MCIVRIIKARRMKWAGSVACMGELKNSYRIWVESLKRMYHSENLGIDGKVLLQYVGRRMEDALDLSG
jgi:hypothetical protein